MAANVLSELLARNSKFSETHTAPPDLLTMAKAVRSSGLGTVILSCSDPRLNPYQIFGIDPTIKGITMVRNAGGRALDAMRTIAVLQTIGNPSTIVVVHHTDCGMTHFHDAEIKKALIEIAPQEKDAINATKYGEIVGSIEESLEEDVGFLGASPFIRPGTRIVGLKHDINTGVVTQINETQAGN
ncbi:carbonic anhydrase [Lophiostoma macrostomum CBS 122681]|uniref:Carbonic anhydrase n=1 Tax=Lophiostoma macrostomum CBS 122681 TaxID=1314788 RepID=A0A6A6SLS4_9PLEO|nr:carbonic anhydrase [Lophiostoma macrostomum CBS 122681]